MVLRGSDDIGGLRESRQNMRDRPVEGTVQYQEPGAFVTRYCDCSGTSFIIMCRSRIIILFLI